MTWPSHRPGSHRDVDHHVLGSFADLPALLERLS